MLEIDQNRCNYYKPSKVEFNSANYQTELIDAFETKSHVFYQLIQKYKHSLSSVIDDAFYGGIGLLINTTQNKYRTQDQVNSDRVKPYNFYKDSNIPEVYNTTSLLDRIETRVQNELKQWPDHAVLIDVRFVSGIIISKKIRAAFETSTNSALTLMFKHIFKNEIVFFFYQIADNHDHWSNSIA